MSPREIVESWWNKHFKANADSYGNAFGVVREKKDLLIDELEKEYPSHGTDVRSKTEMV